MKDYHLNKDKKNFNFAERKDCALHSIKEIEFFLRNLNKGFKAFKVYKFFK